MSSFLYSLLYIYIEATGEGHPHEENKREFLDKKIKDTEPKWAQQEWWDWRPGQGCAVGWQPLKHLLNLIYFYIHINLIFICYVFSRGLYHERDVNAGPARHHSVCADFCSQNALFHSPKLVTHVSCNGVLRSTHGV